MQMLAIEDQQQCLNVPGKETLLLLQQKFAATCSAWGVFLLNSKFLGSKELIILQDWLNIRGITAGLSFDG